MDRKTIDEMLAEDAAAKAAERANRKTIDEMLAEDTAAKLISVDKDGMALYKLSFDL